MGQEKENNLLSKSLLFAKEIVLLYRYLLKQGIEKDILSQLLRSATSVGANVAEAQGGFSDNDYLSKAHIASKELQEATFWLELLLELGDISQQKYLELTSISDELSKILYTIIKNIRSKNNEYLNLDPNH